MLTLSDKQLAAVMAAAARLPLKKRDVFLQRLAAVAEVVDEVRDTAKDKRITSLLRPSP